VADEEVKDEEVKELPMAKGRCPLYSKTSRRSIVSATMNKVFNRRLFCASSF
jgi:hypothetical protein